MSDEKPGLAWPDHDGGPVPPNDYRSRERDEDRRTRKPLAWWDRVKILLLLVGAWALFAWAAVATNPPLQTTFAADPLLGLQDAVNLTLASYGWLLVLAGLELIRQIHYFISERSARYHRFWSQRVFGGWNRRAARMNDWNRFRLARAAKWLFVLLLLDLLLAKLYSVHPAAALFQLPAAVVAALPFGLRLAFYFFIIIFQFAGIFWFLSRGGTDVYYPDDIKTRFTDVWGQDTVLAKVKENIVFLEEPEKIEEKGGYVPGGVLLWGPPGTGKTLMAEAVAGETGKPFIFVDPGAFINMFMGVGILKVKALFRKARKLALRYGGVIMFFDEADALGNRGALAQGGWGQGMVAGPWAAASSCNGLSYLHHDTATAFLSTSVAGSVPDPAPRRLRDRIIMGGMGGGGMGTLQALLTELSGLKKPRGFLNRVVRKTLGMRPKPPPKYRIMVMMATNMPQSLDEALLRPGRLDRIYKVGYPSKAGRVRTYEGYLAKVPHELTAADVDKLATITPYATGASMKDVVNEALINAFRDGRDVITMRDIIKAKQLKDLGPSEDVEYIERERHAIAVHEACHALAAYRMRRHLTIDIATIEKGGTYLGMVSSIKPEDQFTRWRSEYEADIIVSLASLAGERLFFESDNSSGVSGDLESATYIATMMEGYWGMGSTVASHGVTKLVGIPGGGGKPGEVGEKEQELLRSGLGERIEDNLGALLRRAEQLLADNRRDVLAVAHALESHKTMSGEDVIAVIEGQQGPVVDGRWYRTQEFLDAAEAYHRLALESHKGHTKLAAPLPRWAGELEPVAASHHADEHDDRVAADD